MGITKKIAIIIVVVFIAFLAVLFALYDRKGASFDTDYKAKYLVLKNTLKNSGYFEDSTFKYNDETDVLTIDDKYNVYVKSGYYSMNIKNNEEREVYCNVVDAVEMHLGHQKGDSIETCNMTIDGIIDIGGISITDYKNYQTLSVNYKDKSILYSSESKHVLDEYISVDEQNYTIEDSSYIFSSITSTYSEELKEYSICGNLYNDRISDGNFTFDLYDSGKGFLQGGDYQYDNENDKYKSFCVEFKNVEINPSYYVVHWNK